MKTLILLIGPRSGPTNTSKGRVAALSKDRFAALPTLVRAAQRPSPSCIITLFFSALGKYFQLESFLKARQHAVVQKELESLLQINSNFTAGRILMCKTAFGIQDWEVLLEHATTLYSSYPKYYDAHM